MIICCICNKVCLAFWWNCFSGSFLALNMPSSICYCSVPFNEIAQNACPAQVLPACHNFLYRKRRWINGDAFIYFFTAGSTNLGFEGDWAVLGIVNTQNKGCPFREPVIYVLEGDERGCWWRVQGNHKTTFNTQSSWAVVFIGMRKRKPECMCSKLQWVVWPGSTCTSEVESDQCRKHIHQRGGPQGAQVVC